jgi:hypothetical protein
MSLASTKRQQNQCRTKALTLWHICMGYTTDHHNRNAEKKKTAKKEGWRREEMPKVKREKGVKAVKTQGSCFRKRHPSAARVESVPPISAFFFLAFFFPFCVFVCRAAIIKEKAMGERYMNHQRQKKKKGITRNGNQKWEKPAFRGEHQ